MIKVDTQQFHFFKCLYENFPNAVEHQKIVRYLVNGKAESGDNKAKYSSQHSTYLSNIKKNINKDILKYIISPKGNYQLLDSPSS